MQKIKLIKYVKIKYAIIKVKRTIRDIWWFIISHFYVMLIMMRIVKKN